MRTWMLLVVAVATAACSKKDADTGAASASALKAPTPEARELFKGRCTPCHGDSGKGDGPGAMALNPKPRDYTNAVWQKSVTDEDLKKVILYGGAATGKSPAMPGNPDLEGKPEVLDGLIGVIRSYGGK